MTALSSNCFLNFLTKYSAVGNVPALAKLEYERSFAIKDTKADDSCMQTIFRWSRAWKKWPADRKTITSRRQAFPPSYNCRQHPIIIILIDLNDSSILCKMRRHSNCAGSSGNLHYWHIFLPAAYNRHDNFSWNIQHSLSHMSKRVSASIFEI